MSNPVFDALFKKVESEPYARKLGIELVKLDHGYSLVKMVYSKDMDNIFGMAHGGAIYSLIDEAFETSANSHGTIAVALSVNVSYIKPAAQGDILFAEAKEVSRSFKIGTYEIKVTNDKDELIATCQAVAYRKKDKLPFLDLP
ncbi:MAG: hotdog fold thioesterase [Methanosarcinaceae archaeon]|nr:hotdog fold thioesterase [Methanosarcinaceae archaeon]